MSRTTLIMLILSAPLWVGVALVLWQRDPLLVLVPAAIISLIALSGALWRLSQLQNNTQTTHEDHTQ